MWSDKSGRHAATRESVRVPGDGWSWAGDWLIDHHTPGGVDRDGWQYATDFPASYHSNKTVSDFVRRRRWARRCRLVTAGPWDEVASTRLLDISLASSSSAGDTRVWAVATNGEVLLRSGVSFTEPKGMGWGHVKSDVLFQVRKMVIKIIFGFIRVGMGSYY